MTLSLHLMIIINIIIISLTRSCFCFSLSLNPLIDFGLQSDRPHTEDLPRWSYSRSGRHSARRGRRSRTGERERESERASLRLVRLSSPPPLTVFSPRSTADCPVRH